MRAGLAYTRFMDRIADFLSAISRYLVLILIVIGFGNVILRYVGELVGARLTSNEVIEAQWYAYGLIFLLALPFVLKNHINVRVDFWYTKQSPKRKAWIDLIGHFVGLLPFALLGIWISTQAARTSWRIQETSPEGGLAYYPIKTVIALVMVLLFLQGIAEVIKLVAVLRGATAPIKTEEPEDLRIE